MPTSIATRYADGPAQLRSRYSGERCSYPGALRTSGSPFKGWGGVADRREELDQHAEVSCTATDSLDNRSCRKRWGRLSKRTFPAGHPERTATIPDYELNDPDSA